MERGDGGGTIHFGPELPFGLSRSGNFVVGGRPARRPFWRWTFLATPAKLMRPSSSPRRRHNARNHPLPGTKPARALPPPAKLLPPPPRRVHGRLGGSLWFTRIFIMPHVLIGIGVAGYLAFLLLWRLFGVDYPATVVDAKVSRSSKHGDRYILHYRFEAGGEIRLGSDSVGWPVYQNYQNTSPGQTNPPVMVHYLGLGPLHHATLREAGSPWAEIGFLSLWALFWNGVLSIFVYQIWVKPLRVRRLYQFGNSTSGKLLHKRMRTGKSSTYYVSYRFNDPFSSQIYESEIQVWKADDWQQAVEGQPVTVLFAQNNPKRSTVYEFGGYRIEGV